MQFRFGKTAVLAAAAIVGACSSDAGSPVVTPPPVPVASVSVALDTAELMTGDSTRATATVRDGSGKVMNGLRATWTSSDDTIASVSPQTGLVTALGEGTATITASTEGKTGAAMIRIWKRPVATVTVSIDPSTVSVGATLQAAATLKDAWGRVLTGRALTWSSSNNVVATVSPSGVVTGVTAGSAVITATSEGKTDNKTVSVTPAPAVPVATVTVSLASSNIATGATTTASAVTRDANGNALTGRAVTWSSSNNGIATVNPSGVVTAVATGSANIIAISEGKTGMASVTVTAVAIPVASVSVSLGSASIVAGATTTATAVTKDASGNTLTGRALAWSSSNTAAATVNASTGIVTGVAAGTANITATSEGKMGSATVTVTAAVLVATQVAITTQPPASVQSGGALSPAPVVQLQSASNTPVNQAGVVVTASIASGSPTIGGTLTATTNASGTATFSNLTLAGSGPATIRFSATGLTAATSSSVSVTTPPPPPPPPGSGTVLFEEKFEDGNLASRGWYDGANPFTALSAVEHIPGSTKSAQWQFNQGATNPASQPGARHLFTPSNNVYVRYWVKHSSNWVGSGRTYHPHQFYLLTTEDNAYVGPAYTRLTAYIEDNFAAGNGSGVLGIQDGVNIDVTRINQDLTNVTENRGVAGCNGNPDGIIGSCYQSGAYWFNGKNWKTPPVLTSTAGPGYKNDWHQVEVYFQLNTISGGKGQPDGVVQYWFDGQLIIDRHDVFFRTAARPNMKFNQFVMGPYMGDGSPIAQTMWIDDLIVKTSR